jgi:hypothetical protein
VTGGLANRSTIRNPYKRGGLHQPCTSGRWSARAWIERLEHRLKQRQANGSALPLATARRVEL